VLQVVDIATGAGRTVRAIFTELTRLAEVGKEFPVRIHAVDTGSDLDDDILGEPRVRSVIADLSEPLPFADASIDRVISVNVAEHMADPRGHVTDCFRVLRPGGLLVLAHSDWDTTMFASEDDALTRKLVDRFVSKVPEFAERADGFMGRKLLGLARATEFELLEVATWADLHRRFDEGSVGWKVARGVLAAAADDAQLAAEAANWVTTLRRMSEDGRFLFTVTDVALALRRPVSA